MNNSGLPGFNFVRVRDHLIIKKRRKIKLGMRINASKYRILEREEETICSLMFHLEYKGERGETKNEKKKKKHISRLTLSELLMRSIQIDDDSGRAFLPFFPEQQSGFLFFVVFVT